MYLSVWPGTGTAAWHTCLLCSSGRQARGRDARRHACRHAPRRRHSRRAGRGGACRAREPRQPSPAIITSHHHRSRAPPAIALLPLAAPPIASSPAMQPAPPPLHRVELSHDRWRLPATRAPHRAAQVRAVEAGSQLVACPAGSSGPLPPGPAPPGAAHAAEGGSGALCRLADSPVVLQMPRGNLEVRPGPGLGDGGVAPATLATQRVGGLHSAHYLHRVVRCGVTWLRCAGDAQGVAPRPLVLAALLGCLRRRAFGEAWRLATAHRVDLNLLVGGRGRERGKEGCGVAARVQEPAVRLERKCWEEGGREEGLGRQRMGTGSAGRAEEGEDCRPLHGCASEPGFGRRPRGPQVDYRWPAFLAHAGAFAQAVRRPSELCDLLFALRPGSVLEPGSAYAGALELIGEQVRGRSCRGLQSWAGQRVGKELWPARRKQISRGHRGPRQVLQSSAG
jgi:hypothetical protein